MSELLPARAPYWGQAANRCRRPTGTSGSAIWARTEDVVWPTSGGFPRVGWARWYIQNQDEKLPSTDGTLLVRMEYPTNVFTYATENIAAGSEANPAAVPHANNSTLYLNFNKYVPAWQGPPYVAPRFRVIQAGGSVVYTIGPGPDQAAPGCYLQTGTSGSPPAMGDAFPGGAGEYSYPPVSYLVQMRRPSVMLFGDSREEGPYTETARPPTYQNGLIAAAVAAQMGIINMSESATTLAQFLAAPNKARRLELAANVSHIACLLAYNDMFGASNRTAAAVLADATAFSALLPGKIVFGATIMGSTSTTDGQVTKANQGLSANGRKGRDFNRSIRAGVSGLAFHLDVEDAVNPERSGLFPVSRNPFEAARATGCVFTGSISGSVLTVTAITSGSLNYGDPLTDSLTSIATTQLSGCTVLDQLTGTTGQAGTYTISRPQTLASRTLYVGGYAAPDNIHQTKDLAEQVFQRLTPAIQAAII